MLWGEFFEADVQTPADVSLFSTMTILDANGAVVKTVGASANPTTGNMSSNPSYGFFAPTTGTVLPHFLVRMVG